MVLMSTYSQKVKDFMEISLENTKLKLFFRISSAEKVFLELYFKFEQILKN